MSGPIPIKIVVVGDVGTGKTSLVQTYLSGEFPDDQIQDNLSPFTVLQSKVTGIQGEMCSISLWDTSSNEEMDRLRPLSYAQTDLFILCFSIVQPESYESIRAKWSREMNFHAHETPIVLMGLMSDLRSDESIKTRLADRQLAPIVEEQGHNLAKQLGARCYVECSALTRAGLVEAIEKGIGSVLVDVKSASAAFLRKKLEEENKANLAEANAQEERDNHANDGDGIQMTNSVSSSQATESIAEKKPESGGGCCTVM
mmetsp:Transcript_13774/g.16398  ORF Transcript_13774/g.16398 Transcript_13774/m.16398 type:complete len:257 (+) Transcript_13774:224-994(+)